MAMTYTSLVANKGVSGSIANWVSYTKLDLPPIVDEAQALLWTFLRCREMTSKYSFFVPVGNTMIPVPTGFLEPIGRMVIPSINYEVVHKDAPYVMSARNYSETTGTLGTNPFTTTIGSSQFSVTLANHGFNQESPFNIQGATSANGIVFNGTFDIVSITNVNTFVCDTLTQSATANGADGGASVTYICDNLQQTSPGYFAVWDEAIHFDGSFPQAYNMQMLYYKSLPLLSNTNQSNFLTNRYPHLMRTACQAAAADFMKDDTEYQKSVTRLQTLVQSVMAENDMRWRGTEIYTETP